MKFKRPNGQGYRPHHPHRVDKNNKVKRLYRIWIEMRSRCMNPKRKNYKWYGGKGIKVDDRWYVYLNFHEDMSQAYYEHVKKFGEKNTSLDRINVNGHYCKENCKWSTLKEQHSNKSNTIYITHNHKTQTLEEWSKDTKLSKKTIYYRIFRYKWSIKDALSFEKRHRKYIQTLTFAGKTQTIRDWSKESGINELTIRKRIKKGKMSVEQILTTKAIPGGHY